MFNKLIHRRTRSHDRMRNMDAVRAEEQNFHGPTFEQDDEGKTQRAARQHLLSDNLCSDKNKIRARNYSFPKPRETEMAFLKLVKG